MLRGMDPQTLRYLVYTLEEGSIRGGARRAMVAQPAVSRGLRRLEREVGTPLLERSATGVAPTPAGAALVVRARRILRDLDAARTEASGVGARPFTVGLVAGHVAAGELTMTIVDRFRRLRPDLDLRVRELDFAEQFTHVLDGAVDVAVVRSPYDHDGLAMAPLFSEPIVLAASTRHRLAGESTATVETAMQETTLDIVRTPVPWREFWSLGAARRCPGGTVPSQAVNLLDFSLDLLRHETVNPIAQSAWRLGGFSGRDMRALPLVDAPRSLAGVGYRGDDARPEISTFIGAAQEVVSESIGLVPGGRTELTR